MKLATLTWTQPVNAAAIVSTQIAKQIVSSAWLKTFFFMKSNANDYSDV